MRAVGVPAVSRPWRFCSSAARYRGIEGLLGPRFDVQMTVERGGDMRVTER